MGKELLPPGSGESAAPVDLKKALEERYLAYALSTIMHRALPDVRDGLKPVHRRIMHTMRLLRLNPDQGFAKCARIVGDVMGKFHPHGDQSIYDALVRLAQPFAMRYPLVDGQGNFGNIDGDNAAAMRYTEARMTEVAVELLAGITEDAVDFRPTYNEEDEEPVVLPGAFPNLLCNGSSGIAVGMATSIPPHNAAEVCDAALALIDDPETPVERLLDFVKGPDFPTGGIIVEDKASIREAYETGRGGFRLRARWHKEDQGRGMWNAVVTEIPYGIQKSKLIEKIAELILSRKLPLLEDVRDESAEDIRIVLVPKSRTVEPELLMESLFRLTDLETRFPLNMNVLSRGRVPGVLSLRQVLREWLDHRREVLLRRSRHRLAEIEKRLEILAGYLIAYLNIDEVIRIIREEDEPKPVMMARFNLTDTQAEAILNMRLRALRKLEEFEIRTEFEKLSEEKTQIEALLASEERQWKTVRWEVAKVRQTFDPEKNPVLGRRRTTFGEAPAHDLEDVQQAMIEREPITVILSEKGWIRAMKGHISDLSGVSFKEGDSLKLSFHAQTTDKILLFTTGGKFYTLGADRLPGGRGHGEPVRIMIDMENDQAIVTAFAHDPERKLLLASYAGNGFVVPEKDVVANTRKGKQIMNVKAPDEARLCMPVTGDHVAVVGENRKLLVFPLAQVPEMVRGKGVRLQRYRDGGIADIKTFALADGLTWQDSAERTFTRSREDLLEWMGDRAAAGRMAPKGFPRSGKFSA
ncbi:DNA topoisomerase IV subunit A [Chelativorans sp. SCAU2101]|uniref:DNA topoisomerase 4 subunit A n=1 Tax=Chelativorans petroleitrophicus TaxID=2975484 RepID=A0A9X2XA07_9HYPH|nr:DNA topoisomerase IV subunit A [Chelativorans petroleitrophicus]MCT8991269.1 DNA topoisomerase IV subunit A [Chelativorans petroleitrophicus]